MSEEYLLVHKDCLPKYYEVILKAKEEIESKNGSISEVCKKLNISRSTYYKYKDLVFFPSNGEMRKATITFRVKDIPGILIQILEVFSKNNCNILTISQNMPINHVAFISLTIDIHLLTLPLEKLLKEFSKEKGIYQVEVISHE